MNLTEELTTLEKAGYSESYPVTVADVKAQVRAMSDAEDELLKDYIETSIEIAEDETLRALVPTKYLLNLSRFPYYPVAAVRSGSYNRDNLEEDLGIKLPRPMLQEIESFTYKDINGDEQTIAAEDYRVYNSTNPAIFPLKGEVWPEASGDPNCIAITYTADAPAIISKRVTRAIITMVATFWRFRETHTTQEIKEMDGFMSIRNMLAKSRRYEW